ncbi:MAG TPA: hypothetical protein VJN67_18185, partial [Stellaceae bacterium]|nr:hypothetical protein [Stellaceae bacterium]
MMKRLCAVLGLALLAAAPLAAARAADAVKTRAAEHEHYGRIAFDWPAPVTFDAKVDGGTLTIHFDRALETSLGPITGNIGAYVASVSLDADGTTLTAQLKRSVTLKTFTEGNTVAIDLVDAASPATSTSRKTAQKHAAKSDAEPAQAGGTPPASEPAATDKPTMGLRAGEHQGYHRLVLEWKQTYTLTELANGARLHFPRAIAIDTDRIAGALPGTHADLADDEGGTTLTLQLPEGGRLRHFRSDEGNIVLDLVAGAATIAKADSPKPHGKAAPAKPGAAPAASAPAATASTVVPPPELIEPSAGVTAPLPATPAQPTVGAP